jgi:hypothetical protein
MEQLVSVVINRSVERQIQEYQERQKFVVLNSNLRNTKMCKDVAQRTCVHPSIVGDEKIYSFCLMVEASDHGYVLHTRRIYVTRYRIRYDISDFME